MSDVPAELIGQYDIVHVRLFVFVVKNDDAKAILRKMVLLLSIDPLLQALGKRYSFRLLTSLRARRLAPMGRARRRNRPRAQNLPVKVQHRP